MTAPPSPTSPSLLDRYLAIRSHTEELAAPLSAEDQTAQSMADVSPTKWHRAHTTWFWETFVLGPYAPDHRPFDERYGSLFNSYYEAVGPRAPRPTRGLITRPGIAEIAGYRAAVDAAMAALLGARDGSSAAEDGLAAIVELGLQHEQQHQELVVMDIKHVLFQNPLRPAYGPSPAADQGADPWVEVSAGAGRDWVELDGGLVELGAAGDGFAFDNEGPRHRVWLDPYRLSGRLVTCGDWLEFMADGGYERPELWLSEGWATVGSAGWNAPLYWDVTAEGHWQRFGLAGMVSVVNSEPVCHVSQFEADAFARWAGARLPTEAEWEHAVFTAPERFDGCFGRVWQWTASPYVAYPGFAPAAGAVGEYNGKFMSNQMVLRGSSCATPAGHSRPTYRNFFPSAARWVFGGLRLAHDA